MHNESKSLFSVLSNLGIALFGLFEMERILLGFVRMFDIEHLEIYARYMGAIGSIACGVYLIAKAYNEIKKARNAK